MTRSNHNSSPRLLSLSADGIPEGVDAGPLVPLDALMQPPQAAHVRRIAGHPLVEYVPTPLHTHLTRVQWRQLRQQADGEHLPPATFLFERLVAPKLARRIQADIAYQEWQEIGLRETAISLGGHKVAVRPRGTTCNVIDIDEFLTIGVDQPNEFGFERSDQSSPTRVTHFWDGEVHRLSISWAATTATDLRNACGNDGDILPIVVAYDLSRAFLCRTADERQWEAKIGQPMQQPIEAIRVAPDATESPTGYCSAIRKVYVLDYPRVDRWSTVSITDRLPIY